MNRPSATDLAVVLDPLLMDLHELPEGVLVLDRSGRIQAANSAFVWMTRRRHADVVDAPLTAVVAEEDMLHLVGFDALFGAGPVQDVCVMFRGRDDEHCPLVVCTSESRDGTRIVMTARPAGAVQRELADTSRWAALEQERAFLSDQARDVLAEKNEALREAQSELQLAYSKLEGEMEARQRLEHELVLAQKLEAVGQLAAGVAHEINTPMQYVGDNVEFMVRAFQRLAEYLDTVNAALDDDARWRALPPVLVEMRKKLRLDWLGREAPKALQGAKEGVEHVSSIVAAFKAFSHMDGDEMAPSDINRALLDTLTVAQNEYKDVADVATDLAELPAVSCFVGKLRQVFLNLVVNAAHAIVDAARDRRGRIRIASAVVDGCIEVTVSDDGCGIPEAIRSRIFDPFFTTKGIGRGSGQGLYLARRIVMEVHGGVLGCESVPGEGTTFTVRLPLHGEVQNSTSQSSAHADAGHKQSVSAA
jgi:signal transduction histidine kinase